MQAAAQPTMLTIHETVEQRDARIRHLVAEALAAQPAPPRLVDDRAAAQAIDTHPATMARLAREGAPHYTLGDRRRWDIAELKEYLRAPARSSEGATSSEASE